MSSAAESTGSRRQQGFDGAQFRTAYRPTVSRPATMVRANIRRPAFLRRRPARCRHAPPLPNLCWSRPVVDVSVSLAAGRPLPDCLFTAVILTLSYQKRVLPLSDGASGSDRCGGSVLGGGRHAPVGVRMKTVGRVRLSIVNQVPQAMVLAIGGGGGRVTKSREKHRVWPLPGNEHTTMLVLRGSGSLGAPPARVYETVGSTGDGWAAAAWPSRRSGCPRF